VTVNEVGGQRRWAAAIVVALVVVAVIVLVFVHAHSDQDDTPLCQRVTVSTTPGGAWVQVAHDEAPCALVGAAPRTLD
jgi:hypothetical protein